MKEEQATKEEYRTTDEARRDSARKTNAQLQLELIMDINGNKSSFYHYFNIKSLNREHMQYLLNRNSDLETVDLGKALHTFVSLSFIATVPRP